jgi:hypothetical protein
MSYRSLLILAASPHAVLTPELEARLKNCIQTALTASLSAQTPPQEVVALLEEAWQAQRLLWKLRDAL